MTTADVTDPRVEHLDLLESHASAVVREVAAESERPVVLCSGGAAAGTVGLPSVADDLAPPGTPVHVPEDRG